MTPMVRTGSPAVSEGPLIAAERHFDIPLVDGPLEFRFLADLQAVGRLLEEGAPAPLEEDAVAEDEAHGQAEKAQAEGAQVDPQRLSDV